jgi:VRR-NUC domain
MTEAKFTAKLLKALRAHPALDEAVIWKFNDRVSAGIPDFAIVIGRRTLWVEVKIHPNKLSKIQKYYLDQIKEGGVTIYASTSGNTALISSRGTSTELVTLDVLVLALIRLAKYEPL